MKYHKQIFVAILRHLNNEPDIDLTVYTDSQLDWHQRHLAERLRYIEPVTASVDDSTSGVGYRINDDGKKALALVETINPF